jgi:hypothetical protein
MNLKTAPRQNWLKSLGIAGFLFFAIKGLVWLSIPALVAIKGCSE